MSRKRKIFVSIVVITIASFLLTFYIVFLGGDKRYDFIPFVLGTFTTCAIYVIVHFGGQPDELGYGDYTSKDCSVHQSGDGSMIDPDKH